MREEKDGKIQVLARKKFRVLAEQNNWSIAYAEGYFNGKAQRRLGKPPTSYILIGIDQYPEGFRAGYFGRQNPPRATALPADHWFMRQTIA
jgi:hypothetical protein